MKLSRRILLLNFILRAKTRREVVEAAGRETSSMADEMRKIG
jgi:hypothetical protein